MPSFLFQLACAAAGNGLLLWFFYNRFWYAPDEGNYAHVAERLLSGEILNLHVQDVHPGYINFVNAAAFRLFGLDLLSLRYPLVTIAFVQAILIFLLFYFSGRRRLAAAAAIAINALGLVHFLNPTSNWYSLFLTILILCALQWIPRDAGYRLLVVGFLIGALVLFRQLSGILVCMGVLAYLLLEAKSATAIASIKDSLLARLLVAIMSFGLAAYLLRATDAIGFALFGACPLIILIWLFARTTADNRQVLRIVIALAAGGTVACLPLIAYHLLHGSLQAWLNDTVVSAVGLTKLSFMGQQVYGRLIFAGLWQAFRFGSIGEVLNGLYWFLLPLLAFINGVLLLRSVNRGSAALPVIAVFYGVVSVHFQIAIYLYYTAGLSLAGIMWLAPFKPRVQYSVLAVSLILCGVAVYYHAGQPLSGKFADTFGGTRNITSLTGKTSSLPRASLKIEAEEEQRYADVLRIIDSETKPGETIFAIPSNAELYFLSGRRNPFRFFNSALGIRTESDLQHVKETIIAQPPKLVLHRADDKYNTNHSREILELVQERYDFLGDTAGFSIYRSR